MAHLIDKDALVAEIERRLNYRVNSLKAINNGTFWKEGQSEDEFNESLTRCAFNAAKNELFELKCFLDTLEVVNPYEQWIQYASIEAGIKAHAEEYSFNIESELFNQLTKEQQALWRKEIEEAVISGGYNGLTLAKDPRYEETLEVKEVDLDEVHYKPLDEDFERDAVSFCHDNGLNTTPYIAKTIAKHFFELGLKAHKKG